MYVFWSNIVDWLEKFQLPCMHKFITGIDCPGCGMQRAIIALLRGNLVESIKMYPPLIPITIMLVFLWAHTVFKFKHGAKMLTYLFVINVIIIIVNFLYKLLF